MGGGTMWLSCCSVWDVAPEANAKIVAQFYKSVCSCQNIPAAGRVSLFCQERTDWSVYFSPYIVIERNG